MVLRIVLIAWQEISTIQSGFIWNYAFVNFITKSDSKKMTGEIVLAQTN